MELLVTKNKWLMLIGLFFVLALFLYNTQKIGSTRIQHQSNFMLTSQLHTEGISKLRFHVTTPSKETVTDSTSSTSTSASTTSTSKPTTSTSKRTTSTSKPTTSTSKPATSSSRPSPTTTQDTVSVKEIPHSRCYNPPAGKRVTHPLTAQQVADALSNKFEISARTLRDITEAIDLNIVSINSSDINNIKVILGYHGYEHTPHYTWYNFTHCEYTNCIALNPHRTEEHPMAPEPVAKAASVILFNLVEMYHGSTLHKIPRRSDQYFGVTSLESTGYSYNLMPESLNGLMNMTLTYHRKSTVPEWHIFRACIDRRPGKIQTINYAAGKTKGALAYVSNCFSMQYNRLAMMKELSKYIEVKIYGACGEPDPCKRNVSPPQCRATLHRQYHFYLSFENSLCEDYITEKFWDRLSDPDYMLPVAMGGLTVEEYTEQAPPNSFIHARNFTTVEALGSHLKYLMSNSTAYNAYHEWRESYEALRRPIYTRFPSCELCRIANERPVMPADDQLSTKYNNPNLCREYQWK